MSSPLRTISIDEFKEKLLDRTPIIDVRAPIEFQSGAIPGSINLPILEDEERALIGTCYKQKGQEKAIELGYQIVAGENKYEKQKKWVHFIQNNPLSIVTCFRGGKRSQITQMFLNEVGLDVPRLEHGYKRARQFFIDELQNYSVTQDMILLTGHTGSAKTELLKKVKTFYPAIDLENLANHRGSAFGKMKGLQPSQADFENNLATEIIRLQEKKDIRPILFEDESRLIGSRHLPSNIFTTLRKGKVIVVKQSLEERINNIFNDYILNSMPSEQLFCYYESALSKIEKRLGGLKTKEIKNDLLFSKNNFLVHSELESNKIWIEKLLVFYYDGLYTSSFKNRNPMVLFEGNHMEIKNFLSDFSKLNYSSPI